MVGKSENRPGPLFHCTPYLPQESTAGNWRLSLQWSKLNANMKIQKYVYREPCILSEMYPTGLLLHRSHCREIGLLVQEGIHGLDYGADIRLRARSPNSRSLRGFRELPR